MEEEIVIDYQTIKDLAKSQQGMAERGKKMNSSSRLVEVIARREAQQGNYPTKKAARVMAASEVLQGFKHLDEASDYAQYLTDGRYIYTGTGYEVSAECLKAAIEVVRQNGGCRCGR